MARPAKRSPLAGPHMAQSWLPPAVAVVLTFLVFLPTLSSGFVDWDDGVNVYANPALDAFDWKHIKAIFSSTIIGNYNPLPILTFAIEKAVFGLNPRVLHFDNLLLHLLCVGLVNRLLVLWKVEGWVAGFAALLFGIHPMRVESVAWITERKDVLFGAFYLGALVSYTRYLKTNFAKTYYWTTLMLFTVGLFAKIQTVALPLSLLALDYFMVRPIRSKALFEKIPFIILSAVFGIIGIYALKDYGSLNAAPAFNPFGRICIGAYSLWTYITKFIVPYPLSPVYPYPTTLSWPYYAAVAATILLVVYIWREHRRGHRVIVFGFLFFFCNIVFVLQVLGAGTAFLADRFSYVPYLGLIFIVARAFDALKDRRSMVVSVAIAWVCVLSALTWMQCSVWRDDNALWTHALKLYPQSSVAQYQMGRTLEKLGKYDASIPYYERATLPSDPSYRTRFVSAQVNLGNALLRNGKTNDALDHFNQALQFDPKQAAVYLNLATVYLQMGDTNAAITQYLKAIELQPTMEQPLFALGDALIKTGRSAEAVRYLQKAIELSPGDADARESLAAAFAQLNRFDDVIAQYSAILELSPQNTKVRKLLAMAFASADRPAEALKELNIVMSSTPADADAYYLSARLLYDTGRTDEAQQMFRKAVGLNPDFVRMPLGHN